MFFPSLPGFASTVAPNMFLPAGGSDTFIIQHTHDSFFAWLRYLFHMVAEIAFDIWVKVDWFEAYIWSLKTLVAISLSVCPPWCWLMTYTSSLSMLSNGASFHGRLGSWSWFITNFSSLTWSVNCRISLFNSFTLVLFAFLLSSFSFFISRALSCSFYTCFSAFCLWTTSRTFSPLRESAFSFISLISVNWSWFVIINSRFASFSFSFC